MERWTKESFLSWGPLVPTLLPGSWGQKGLVHAWLHLDTDYWNLVISFSTWLTRTRPHNGARMASHWNPLLGLKKQADKGLKGELGSSRVNLRFLGVLMNPLHPFCSPWTPLSSLFVHLSCCDYCYAYWEGPEWTPALIKMLSHVVQSGQSGLSIMLYSHSHNS